jgi:uncharacterized protein YPO0396
MDDSRNYIIHEYDPVKRREYYLKTRQLKGHVPKALEPNKVTPFKTAVKPAPNRQQRQEERRRHLQAQVDQLKARLKKLREALAEMVKAAKARSGVKTPDKKQTNKKDAGNGKKSEAKPTAKQKADAAKRSKEYYEKNKDQLLADEVKSLTAKIKTIQERIAKMRKTSSAGAKNTQNKK